MTNSRHFTAPALFPAGDWDHDGLTNQDEIGAVPPDPGSKEIFAASRLLPGRRGVHVFPPA